MWLRLTSLLLSGASKREKIGWIAEIAEMDKPNAISEYTNSKTRKENPHADQS
jgi:hypothetical protein